MAERLLQSLTLVEREAMELGPQAQRISSVSGSSARLLRTWLHGGPTGAVVELLDDDVDPRTGLAALVPPGFVLSTPRVPVVVPQAIADELLEATTEVVDNVTRHAGPDAQAAVLLVDDGLDVTVRIRDRGTGFAPESSRLGSPSGFRFRCASAWKTPVERSSSPPSPAWGRPWKSPCRPDAMPGKRQAPAGGVARGDDIRSDLRSRVSAVVLDPDPAWRSRVMHDLSDEGIIVRGAGRTPELVLGRIGGVRPEVLVMGLLRTSQTSGAEVIRAMASLDKVPRVLVYTSHGPRPILLDAMRAGALGYLVKPASPAALAEAVRIVAAGGAVLDPSLQGILADELGRLHRADDDPWRGPASGLGQDVVQAILIAGALGFTRDDIATHLPDIVRGSPSAELAPQDVSAALADALVAWREAPLLDGAGELELRTTALASILHGRLARTLRLRP